MKDWIDKILSLVLLIIITIFGGALWFLSSYTFANGAVGVQNFIKGILLPYLPSFLVKILAPMIVIMLFLTIVYIGVAISSKIKGDKEK